VTGLPVVTETAGPDGLSVTRAFRCRRIDPSRDHDDGIFEVYADGDLMFDKNEDDYGADTIVDAVGERVGAAA